MQSIDSVSVELHFPDPRSLPLNISLSLVLQNHFVIKE